MEEALRIVKSVVQNCDSEVGKRFRARCRREIETIAYSGLHLALAVLAARSSAEVFNEALSGRDIDAFIRGVCMNKDYARKLGLGGSEEKSYAIYGASLAYVLKKLNAVKATRFDELLLEAGNPLVEVQAFRIATWLKRLAEAYIHEG